MDDQKMKIKIVVRPEDARGADDAAAEARRARIRRNRLGLVALSALVALGAVVAFFFIGGEPQSPELAERQPPTVADDAAIQPPPDGATVSTSPAASGAGGATEGGPTANGAKGSDGEAQSGGPTPSLASSSGSAQGADREGADRDNAGDNGSATPAAPAGDASSQEPTQLTDTHEAARTQADAEQPPAPPAVASQPSPAAPSQIDGGGGDAVSPPPAGERSASPRVGNVVPNPAPGRAAPSSLGQATTSAPKQGRGSATGQASGQPPSVAAIPAKPSPGVGRAQLTSRVAGREPVDVMRSPVEIGPQGRNVYYFTEFHNLNGQTVTHRWEYNGQVVATIPFRIGGDRWRVYSSKQIGPTAEGSWRVSAVDRRGTVLASAAFTAN